MRLPLLFHAKTKPGFKGATVQIFEGKWVIDWPDNTRFQLHVDGSIPIEITSGHIIQGPSRISLEVLQIDDRAPILNAWVSRL